MLDNIMNRNNSVFEMKLPFNFMLKRDWIFYHWWQTVIFFICVEFSLENLFDSVYSVFKHADKIFNCQIKWLLKMKRKDCHLELLISTSWVNEYFLDIFDKFLKSWWITNSWKHWEKLKLNCLTKSIKFNGHCCISTHNDLFLITLHLRMNFII